MVADVYARTARRARGGGNVARPVRETLSADGLLSEVLKFKIGGGGGGGVGDERALSVFRWVGGWTCGGGSDSSKRVAAGACAISYARGAAAAEREVPFFDAPPPTRKHDPSPPRALSTA